MRGSDPRRLRPGDVNRVTRIVYFNGALLPEGKAAISIDNGGWLHGAGLFETMRAANGHVLQLNAHLDRLRRSAAKLLLPIEPASLPSGNQLAALVEQNALTDARIRLTVSAGPMYAGGASAGHTGNAEPSAPSLTVCATVAPLVPYAPQCYSQGVRAAVCDFRVSPTDPVAGHKTTSYLPRLLGLRAANRKRCLEALWFTTSNELAEGCVSNVFVVKDAVVKTPRVETPVLPGIARRTVLDAARAIGMETRECPLHINDLLDADEAFLTNTIMEVLPLVGIENSDVKDGRVGPIAKKLGEVYQSRVRLECNEA